LFIFGRCHWSECPIVLKRLKNTASMLSNFSPKNFEKKFLYYFEIFQEKFALKDDKLKRAQAQ